MEKTVIVFFFSVYHSLLHRIWTEIAGNPHFFYPNLKEHISQDCKNGSQHYFLSVSLIAFIKSELFATLKAKHKYFNPRLLSMRGRPLLIITMCVISYLNAPYIKTEL